MKQKTKRLFTKDVNVTSRGATVPGDYKGFKKVKVVVYGIKDAN